MPRKIYYEEIKEARTKRDMTQQELAEFSGVSSAIIKALETGRSETSYENVKKLTDVLDLDINEIFVKDFKETKVIAAANNKGGSGKTSVIASLGDCLAELDKKVLLIDSDMQMNLSHSFGIERSKKNLNTAIIEERPLLDFIIQTEFNNIDIIISDYEMAAIEMTLFTKTLRESVFKRMLKSIIDEGIYDYILIDTNPTLGILNFNILNASDYVIVPVEMSAFGILGLEVLTKFIHQVKEINEKLELAGVLRTKVDKRESITLDAQEVLKDVFGDKIFESYISIDTNVKKAQWEQQPLNEFNKSSRANKQYKKFAKELLTIAK